MVKLLHQSMTFTKSLNDLMMKFINHSLAVTKIGWPQSTMWILSWIIYQNRYLFCCYCCCWIPFYWPVNLLFLLFACVLHASLTLNWCHHLNQTWYQLDSHIHYLHCYSTVSSDKMAVQRASLLPPCHCQSVCEMLWSLAHKHTVTRPNPSHSRITTRQGVAKPAEADQLALTCLTLR